MFRSASAIVGLEKKLEGALEQARRARSQVERRDELLREYRVTRTELCGASSDTPLGSLFDGKARSSAPLRSLADADTVLLRLALDPDLLRALETGRKTELLKRVTREVWMTPERPLLLN